MTVALVAAAAACGQAQQLPDAPQPTAALIDTARPERGSALATRSSMAAMESARAATPHRFFDRISLLSTGMETAALLADGITTQNNLGQIRTEYRTVNGAVVPVQVRITEVDPVGKLFVNAGWPGQIAGGALTVGADMGLRYLLHRKNHHRLERVVPFLITASNAFAAISNSRK